ncbi:hypothetical protein AAE02nite_36300 [Adhaeribacter aerolatus]|uniref:Uncharacterized protein n=1 Tax=Adhaeribacter aerolatus TaxID=670289 RepID=A0A512B1Y3_9BACT|nr:hypothetical protein [Adhaeribacter aerolatus]GEO05966.1 hypothetical protein AAE02nite_36300 [Adhaeribacter aerolatus]
MITIIKKGADNINIQKALESVSIRKGVNAFKYCGKVNLEKEPLTIQKNLRNEWE